jgi:two-component system sensor histidine kinase CpxA
MGISVLFWLPFAQAVSRRLRRLTAATEQIAEGRFETRAGVTGHDEIGRLGEAVDAMAGRLDTLVNGQKRFLGDVAHELGSPIARLQVAVEILQQQLAASHEPLLTDVREEVQQMSALVNELLAFTAAGLQSRPARLATVRLGGLVAEVLAQENAAARVRPTVPDDLTVQADAKLLARAVGNLIRNALRYAGEGAGIAVTARREAGLALLTVTDDGPGVPAAALARLGEPFYRPEAARTREGGGVGLGLAIVKASVLACGGQVVFRNRSPHGFEAEIRLGAGGSEITRP